MKNPTLKELDKIRKDGFRPSVICCCLCANKILMLHKKEFGFWMLPQGGVKNKTLPKDAVLKELEEELGKDFVKICDGDPVLFGEDQIEFSEERHVEGKLETDAGTPVTMKGKNYYFYAIALKQEDFDISKTQFDEYWWLEYKGAKGLANKTYQRGKARVNSRIMDLLNEVDLLT